MTVNVKFQCCNRNIVLGTVWFLKDIKGFTSRKLFKGTCFVCKNDFVVLHEKRISDGKVFINKFNGIEAVKTLYREKKRQLTVFPNIKTNSLYGWIYGVNVQLKDKKGKVTKVRQYSKSLTGSDKTLVKEIIY